MPVSRTKQSYEKIPLFVKATHMSYKISLPSGHHQGFRLVHWLPEKWPSSGTVSAAHGNGRPITFDSPRLPHSSQIVDAGNTSLRGAIALSAAFEGIVLFLTVALHHIAFDRLGLFRTIIVTIPCLFLLWGNDEAKQHRARFASVGIGMLFASGSSLSAWLVEVRYGD
ncbi:hypothetical protein V6N13_039324 [Hibiscus sabdariffa]